MKKSIKQLYNDLDSVLDFLYNNQNGFGWEHREIHKQLNLGLKDPTNMFLLCDKLLNDGFLNLDLSYQSYIEKKGDTNITFKIPDPDGKVFYINYHGCEFYMKGGYKNKHTTELKNQFWLTTKIIAVVLNSIFILSIAVYGLILSQNSKELEQKIELLEKRIEDLLEKNEPNML